MNGVCKSCEGCVITLYFYKYKLGDKEVAFSKKFVKIIVPDQNENFLF